MFSYRVVKRYENIQNVSVDKRSVDIIRNTFGIYLCRPFMVVGLLRNLEHNDIVLVNKFYDDNKLNWRLEMNYFRDFIKTYQTIFTTILCNNMYLILRMKITIEYYVQFFLFGCLNYKSINHYAHYLKSPQFSIAIPV